jgi:hypothetical protein
MLFDIHTYHVLEMEATFSIPSKFEYFFYVSPEIIIFIRIIFDYFFEKLYLIYTIFNVLIFF